jgi:hypothetical protein
MKKVLFAGLVILVIVGMAGGVWAWENIGPGRVCATQHSTTFDGFGPDVRTYPTVEGALARFGRYPGIRGDLPPESLKLTDEDSPEFGATIDPDFHADTKGGRHYHIWKNGDVVQSVVIDTHRGGWVIGGYGGCSPIP